MRIREGPGVRSRRRGFTLVELMIGVVILVVAIGAASATQLVAHNLLRTSRETEVAMADLQGAMELAILRKPAALPIAGSEFESGQPVARFNGLHLRNEVVTATYPGYLPGGVIPEPLQIRMTIRWDDYLQRPRTLSLATVRAR